MRQVVFLRNVNQGQRGSPSTAHLLRAFAEAGALDAQAFQSNGTVVVDGPLDLVDRAMVALGAAGVVPVAFTIPLADLAAIVDAHAATLDAHRRELTLHSGARIYLDDAATTDAARRRLRLLEVGDGWVVSVNERDRESNATPVVERLTGCPASSRGLPTLVRLVDRFAEA